jgi:probable HAF family extracellular repeat protein
MVSQTKRIARWAGLLLVLAPMALAQKYTVTDLGVLSGDSASEGLGLSPSGNVVGCSDTSTVGNFPCQGVPGHAFLWSSGTMQDLGTLNGVFSIAYGADNAGHVTGYSLDSQGVLTAFLWTQGTGMKPLGALPGATYSYGYEINSHGVIAGSSNSATSKGKIFAVLWTKSGSKYKIQKLPPLRGAVVTLSGALNDSGEVAGLYFFGKGAQQYHGFIWTQAKGTVDLGTLKGATDSNANAINSAGTVTGYSTTAGSTNWMAVNWDASGKIQRLGILAGDVSSAGEGINDGGQVVGFSANASGASRAILWTKALGMQDLNTLIPANSGWSLIFASAINRKGQITGYGTINGENHGFLLTP